MIYDRMERITLYGSVIPHAEDIKKRWEAGNADGAEYEIRQKSYVTKAFCMKKTRSVSV